YLIKHGQQVIITREPGGTPIGEQIRQLLLNHGKMHHNTELLLYFASRQENIQQVILPSLNAGICVLADRFIDASIAYQGGGRKLGIAKIRQAYALLEPQLTTDLTLLFDVPIKLALERIKRSRQLDRIELESEEFFIRVQQTYHQLMHAEPQRIKHILTNQEYAITRQKITTELDRILANRQGN
ncbi:MAG: hypothetical protein RLZZ293_734, partial [Pseudomonadota bacterium]